MLLIGHIPHQVLSSSVEVVEPERKFVVFGMSDFHMHWVLLVCLQPLQPIRMSAEEGKLDWKVPFQRAADRQLGWKAEGSHQQSHSCPLLAEDIDSWAAVVGKACCPVDTPDLST